MATELEALLLREWVVANRVALAHEIALAQAFGSANAHRSRSLEDERYKVRRMREIADDLWAASMKQMEERAQAIGRRDAAAWDHAEAEK